MKLSDLLQFDDIIVQCHDNPDADALASGFGVYEYLRINGKNPRFVYGGRNIIHKSNLVLMINSLDIPIEHVDFLDDPQLLVTVDCQYGGGNVTLFKAQNIAVIDHHRVSGELPPMNRVMSYMGSCSTIVWDMLREEDVEIKRKLATALYYGLYTDTGEFSEITHSLDRNLRDEADFDDAIVAKFRNAIMSLEELDIAGTALLGRDYIEEHRLAIVKAGACDPNVLGIISDFVLAVDVIDICMVFSVMEDGVKLSFRSCIKEVSASKMAQEVCSDIGSGGGHYYKAGGFIPMDLLTEIYIIYCKENDVRPRLQYSNDGTRKRPSDSAIKSFLEDRLFAVLPKEDRNGGYMMNKTKAVVFDLDGTLLYTLEDLKNAVNYALREKGMPERTLDEVRRFVGNGVRLLMERTIPDGAENPQFEETFAMFKEYYDAHCNENTSPYDGIMDLLEELRARGIKMAIVSNKIDFAVKSLDKLYFKDYMTAAIGEMEEEGVRKKPAPDMVQKALRELGVTQDEAIYVGDSDVDIATAKNSGLKCISVTWGFRDEEFLKEHGATQFIDHPAELLKYV